MGRRLSAGDEKERAECDEEPEKHGFGFVVHHQEPLGMLQVRIQRVNKCDEKQTENHQDDL
jgi:hypothetical protein